MCYHLELICLLHPLEMLLWLLFPSFAIMCYIWNIGSVRVAAPSIHGLRCARSVRLSLAVWPVWLPHIAVFVTSPWATFPLEQVHASSAQSLGALHALLMLIPVQSVMPLLTMYSPPRLVFSAIALPTCSQTQPVKPANPVLSPTA